MLPPVNSTSYQRSATERECNANTSCRFRGHMFHCNTSMILMTPDMATCTTISEEATVGRLRPPTSSSPPTHPVGVPKTPRARLLGTSAQSTQTHMRPPRLASHAFDHATAGAFLHPQLGIPTVARAKTATVALAMQWPIILH